MHDAGGIHAVPPAGGVPGFYTGHVEDAGYSRALQYADGRKAPGPFFSIL
jgi:hypothetical protein